MEIIIRRYGAYLTFLEFHHILRIAKVDLYSELNSIKLLTPLHLPLYNIMKAPLSCQPFRSENEIIDGWDGDDHGNTSHFLPYTSQA